MEILDAIIRAVIQGLTEFLPISYSTQETLIYHFTRKSIDTPLLFSIILHMASVLAIIIVYRKIVFKLISEFISVIKDVFKGKFSLKKVTAIRNLLFMLIISLVPMIGFYIFKEYLYMFDNDGSVLAEGVLMIIMGIVLYIADRKFPGEKKAKNMHIGDSMLTGVFQGVAALPGMSRQGLTMSILILRGYTKEFVVQFSFLMSIPVILILNIKDIGVANQQVSNVSPLVLLIGFIATVLVSIIAIKMIQWIVKADYLNIFAYYNIIIGCIIVILAFVEKILQTSLYELISNLIKSFI